MAKPEDGFGEPLLVRDYVVAHADRGDPESVLRTLDHYAREHVFLMNVGPDKGRILTAEIDKLAADARVLELGAYCGYSAILIALHLDRGRVTSVDIDRESVAAAGDIVDFAGFGDRIELIEGDSDLVLPDLEGPFDLVFLDHWKDLYERDLRSLERHNLLRRGSVVFADNVGPRFDADSYLDYVRDCGRYDTTYHVSTIEYSDEPDAAEISVYRGADRYG